jgi:hypothetical protein
MPLAAFVQLMSFDPRCEAQQGTYSAQTLDSHPACQQLQLQTVCCDSLEAYAGMSNLTLSYRLVMRQWHHTVCTMNVAAQGPLQGLPGGAFQGLGLQGFLLE